jgi:tetratricopeptide (TPR) repeat protein
MPGCQITLNGTDKHVTDDAGGFIFQLDGNQEVKVKVSKTGYKDFETTRKLDCGDSQDVPAFLGANQVMLRIRTVPTECDIYLDNQKQPKGSDAQGIFSYLLTKPNLLIEAKKPKYLSKSRSVQLRPELANGEIVLQLEPLPAILRLSTNVSDAQITIDGKPPRGTSSAISLTPGHHSLSVSALGYSAATFDFLVALDETISRDVKLERLSPSDLQSEAERLLSNRAYDDVLRLSGFISEADHANGAARRLAGLVYLARGDFANAGAQFDQALAVDEPILLHVRRHPEEKFDLNKGHDVCDAQLTLRKNEVEFHGLRNAADDFKVTYDQIQVGTIQLKNSVAAYLATRVASNGKRHDYNFYSIDKELSQSGKPYLEMVQRLLRPH